MLQLLNICATKSIAKCSCNFAIDCWVSIHLTQAHWEWYFGAPDDVHSSIAGTWESCIVWGVCHMCCARPIGTHPPQVFENGALVYLVTELLVGGELLDRLHRHRHLSEREASVVMRVLASTLDYLHQRMVRPRSYCFPEWQLRSRHTGSSCPTTSFWRESILRSWTDRGKFT